LDNTRVTLIFYILFFGLSHLALGTIPRKCTVSIKSVIIFEVKEKVSENKFTDDIRISKINKR
jgi:hypothetical protein